VIEIVKLPDVAERLKSLAVDPAGNTSEEFRQIIARDLPQWKAVATAANIKLD
jgi:tripartite-type tricarboxylate transporter receptor subunit TctC